MTRAWLMAATLAMVPLIASAQKYPVNDEGCSQITSAYLTGNEKRLDWFLEIPQWKRACEHHPDIEKCRFHNDAIKRGNGTAPLNCVGGKG